MENFLCATQFKGFLNPKLALQVKIKGFLLQLQLNACLRYLQHVENFQIKALSSDKTKVVPQMSCVRQHKVVKNSEQKRTLVYKLNQVQLKHDAKLISIALSPRK